MNEFSGESIKVERILSEGPLEDDWSGDEELKHEARCLIKGIRPKTFTDYPGQQAAKENLKIFVKAAVKRGKPLDHVLLHGPPGLGKTTLAHIVANELAVPFITTSGPSIDKPGDLAGILAGLEAGSLLFIDEIHRLTIQVEEVLYGAMEDFAIDIVVGQGPTARSVKMDIAPFTLVGATTKLSSLSRPFLSRFGIQERLMFYNISSLTEIIHRSTQVLGIKISDTGALEIAKRSRGTPRIANRLLRRAWDFAEVKDVREIDLLTVQEALSRLDIDSGGLDRIDREILKIIKERYRGGPVGIEAIAITLGEERATLEEVYEPFLVYQGFLSRGPRGRSLTDLGRTHLESFH
ncbi:MAG: Holliday junction branch migration DNA helicase RuvB [Oligoflexales bacterium]